MNGLMLKLLIFQMMVRHSIRRFLVLMLQVGMNQLGDTFIVDKANYTDNYKRVWDPYIEELQRRFAIYNGYSSDLPNR